MELSRRNEGFMAETLNGVKRLDLSILYTNYYFSSLGRIVQMSALTSTDTFMENLFLRTSFKTLRTRKKRRHTHW